MSTVKAAFHSIAERIQDQSILKIEAVMQDKNKQLRYSRTADFTECIVHDYFNKNIDLNAKPFDRALLKEPYFLSH